jgi:uncharacterized protein YbcI
MFRAGTNPMNKFNSGMGEQIAQVTRAFQQKMTGHAPTSATVVLVEDTLVVLLQGALSPAERVLARSRAGAAQVQEFHRELFTNSSAPLKQEIGLITGVEVREATAAVEATGGTFVQVFPTGTMIQVFLLAHDLVTEADP